MRYVRFEINSQKKDFFHIYFNSFYLASKYSFSKYHRSTYPQGKNAFRYCKFRYTAFKMLVSTMNHYVHLLQLELEESRWIFDKLTHFHSTLTYRFFFFTVINNLINQKIQQGGEEFQLLGYYTFIWKTNSFFIATTR